MLETVVAGGGFDGALLVTSSADKSLGVLLAAVQRYGLMNRFLGVVNGFGNIEKLARDNNTVLSDMTEILKYYNRVFKKTVSDSNLEEIPKCLYHLLGHFLRGNPGYDNFF